MRSLILATLLFGINTLWKPSRAGSVTGVVPPASRSYPARFPSPVQVLPVVVAPSSATLVVCRQHEQHTTDDLRPFPTQADSARGRRKEAGQHSASGSREELLQVDAVTALKVVAREHLACRACLPGESKQAVHVPLLPLQAGRTGAERAREQSLSCMGTRKKACCSQGR